MFRMMLVLLGLLFSQQAIARNLVLIEFDSGEYEATLETIAELEEKGVTARHIFPPHLAIVSNASVRSSV